MHTCPQVTVLIPHVGGPIIGPGVATVLASKMPVSVVGDTCTCVGPPDVIVEGSANVLVQNRPVAALGSKTAHGGLVVAGAPTVLVGTATGGALKTSGKKAKRKKSKALLAEDEKLGPSVAALRSVGGSQWVAPVLEEPTYTLLIDLEQIDSRYDDDEFELESMDGEYSQKRTVREDGVIVDERWLQITFSKVKPGKIYSCHHDLKKTASGNTATLLLFKGMQLCDEDLDGHEIDEADVTASFSVEERAVETSADFHIPDDEDDLALALLIRDEALFDDDAAGREARAGLDELHDSFWLGKESDKDDWVLPRNLPASLSEELTAIDQELAAEPEADADEHSDDQPVGGRQS